MGSPIRAGRYRTVEIDDRRSVIVEVDVHCPFTQLRQTIQVSAVGDNLHHIDNCAVMLAMCLNSGLDTISLHEAIIQYIAGPIVSD